MKALLTICFIYFSFSMFVQGKDSTTDDTMVIDNSSQLNKWCKSESSEYILAQGATPNNWTSSRWVEGEFLFVEGVWKVNGDKRKVECTVRKGTKEKYAKLKILEE